MWCVRRGECRVRGREGSVVCEREGEGVWCVRGREGSVVCEREGGECGV